MVVAGIDCQIPSKKISNEDIIELVKYHSKASFSGKLSDLEILVNKFLVLTGIESRYWRNDEKPIDLLVTCVENALKMSGINRNEIDIVIYSSIDRGYIEPSNASLLCKVLGIGNSRNFDIVDACMGWASALEVASSFLNSSKTINTILIVNAEFPMDREGVILPVNFTISDKKELRWKSASYTLGEGASACVLRKSSFTTQFEFIEDPENAELCTIPLPNFEKYSAKMGRFHELPFTFSAHSTSLVQNGMRPAITVLKKLLEKIDHKPKIIFPHSVSNKIIKQACCEAGIKSLVHSTFSTLGNIATVSVPSAINDAITKKLIKKDQKAVVWIASAGMKYTAFDIHL